jgi:hypothetical protein
VAGATGRANCPSALPTKKPRTGGAPGGRGVREPDFFGESPLVQFGIHIHIHTHTCGHWNNHETETRNRPVGTQHQHPGPRSSGMALAIRKAREVPTPGCSLLENRKTVIGRQKFGWYFFSTTLGLYGGVRHCATQRGELRGPILRETVPMHISNS